MPSSSSLLTMAAAASVANAAYQGFNYGSTFTSGVAKMQSDFETDFTTAASLVGTNGGFTSGRLYTMIQGGTTNDPIQAIPAAISTKTSLLLGLWASAGAADFANEIAALTSAIDQYCNSGFGDVAIGISVGSEDLYRDTPTGIASDAGPGATASTLVGYISQVRKTIKGTCLSGVSIGHVDTWDAWVLSSSVDVIEAIDWLGMDTYPYFQSTDVNPISNASYLYKQALDVIEAVSQGKEVWTTETGWPVSGSASGQAIASTANAQSYWQQVGCPNFGKANMFWYILQDADPTAPNPSFGIVGSTLSSTPLFDLSCAGVVDNSTSSSASGSSTKTASEASSSSTHASGSGSGSGSGSKTGESSSSPAATTGATAPFPSTNGTVPGASASGTGAHGGPSASPVSGSTKLNSFGAAAVAFILAFAAL